MTHGESQLLTAGRSLRIGHREESRTRQRQSSRRFRKSAAGRYRKSSHLRHNRIGAKVIDHAINKQEVAALVERSLVADSRIRKG